MQQGFFSFFSFFLEGRKIKIFSKRESNFSLKDFLNTRDKINSGIEEPHMYTLITQEMVRLAAKDNLLLIIHNYIIIVLIFYYGRQFYDITTDAMYGDGNDFFFNF